MVVEIYLQLIVDCTAAILHAVHTQQLAVLPYVYHIHGLKRAGDAGFNFYEPVNGIAFFVLLRLFVDFCVVFVIEGFVGHLPVISFFQCSTECITDIDDAVGLESFGAVEIPGAFLFLLALLLQDFPYICATVALKQSLADTYSLIIKIDIIPSKAEAFGNSYASVVADHKRNIKIRAFRKALYNLLKLLRCNDVPVFLLGCRILGDSYVIAWIILDVLQRLNSIIQRCRERGEYTDDACPAEAMQLQSIYEFLNGGRGEGF